MRADLVSQHDEMRKHAVTLVHKCRQAETVNAALERECSRMRSLHPELASRVSLVHFKFEFKFYWWMLSTRLGGQRAEL
jgi:hypothetical protein